MKTLSNISNIMPSIRGLNFWTLIQKVKDHTIQKTPTFQLLQKIDIYQLSNSDRAKLLELTDAKEQQEFLKTHGKLNLTTGYMKSHSFVLQFLQVLEATFAGSFQGSSDNVVMKDTGAASRNVTCDELYTAASVARTLGFEAPATITTYGILVGTGTNAPASTDYVIQTLTAHGVSANQLQYQAGSVGAAGVVGANVDMVVSRLVINGSGGAITLKEICIYVKTAKTGWFFMLTHDAVNQAIANGEIAVVSYDFRTTV